MTFSLQIFTKLLAAVLLIYGCAPVSERYRITDEGVLVFPDADAVKTLRINVITDDIIRITATPADSFSSRQSLMVAPAERKKTFFNVTESSGTLSLTTASLEVRVNLQTGELLFLDSSGALLLREKHGGGKSFSYNTDVKGTYSIRQVFESPDHEAFYGLGAHQNGQMNYKGLDVDLVQHNIVAVVPFLYSSFNYGLLWDNYSVSRFGDPREFQPLSSLSLYNKEFAPGGLTATYYADGQVVNTLIEKTIEYEFLETPQVDNFPKEVANSGKVVWEGGFSSDREGVHKFLVYSSGYVKLWIGDDLILDKWRQNWNPWTTRFTVPLKKNEKKSIRIEWIPDGGTYLAVKHLDPLPASEQNQLSLSSEVAENLDYYFIRGNNADHVISGYRSLTGKSPIPPKWALGFWQSRERYRNQQELLEVVKEYRKRNIPLDNIVLDWQYWRDPEWGSHEFDSTRFPDPAGMVTSLHTDLNANIMISVWPKFNKGTRNYDEMNAKGFLFTRNVEKKRKDWVGPGYESTFYDPFSQEAGRLFWNQIDTRLNQIDIDAWWLDATEPDMHSNLSLAERKRNMSPTAIGPGEQYFNAYSLVNARSVYEGQRKSSPGKRVFILTRSAYAGQQRYATASWSGDIVSRWSDFREQISAGINFSMSGIPYWTMDIGGFSVEKRFEKPGDADLKEWRELNARWFQFGAFCPIFRSHGQYPYREIYNIAPAGHPVYNSMVWYSKLRYRLMPYLYSLAGSCYWNDYTMMRGLAMDFGDDPKVHNIDDQFMLGPSLLISPVHQYGATSRKVYLPASSGWYNFYTGEYLKGGQQIQADAPLHRIPLFIKAGSIIPFGPEMQYFNEKPADPLTLYVFTGADAAFTLYEDEGTNYNYEKGEYSTIVIKYEDDLRTLTIGARTGSFKDTLEERTFQLVWVKTDHPAGVGLDARSPQVVRYAGETLTIPMN
jgi:alpha-D-xyloside xylohydrolase